MKNFDDCFGALMGNEGGFTDNPNDPGNWSSGVVGQGMLEGTMWGVSAPVARANGYTGPMQDLPQSLAKAIAKKKYWDPYQLDQIDPNIAFQVMDAAYNGGHPAQWMQQSAGVTADGVIGAQTIAAIRAANVYQFIMRFDSCRLDYLASLKALPSFAGGWMRRIANNLRLGAQ
jgi:lysozyme family protein